MVTFVWWILSLFDICELTWLPVFIDACISFVFVPFILSTDISDAKANSLSFGGIALFAACKYWFSLTISGWWILLAPVWCTLAWFLPGGFTLTNYLFGHFGLMSVPTWVFITGIIADALTLIGQVALMAERFIDRRS